MTEEASTIAQNNNQNSPLSERLIYVVFMYDNYTPYQDAKIHVSTNGNYFGIIL